MLALFPKAGGIRADHTAVSFKLPDIASSIAELQGAGVTFEDFDFPGLKTIGHVRVLGAEMAAWFMDTEANILCQHEDLEERRTRNPRCRDTPDPTSPSASRTRRPCQCSPASAA